MKTTTNFGLNLLELSDIFSPKPLNENAEKIDAALMAQAGEIAARLMMATGSYTGDGTRSVTIQTPGFKPKAMILREVRTPGWGNSYNTCWWIGANIDVSYMITATSDSPPYAYEPGEQFTATIETTISFIPENGKITWSIPKIPLEYYDITSDGGPYAMSNSKGTTYEWIAFGVAE